MLHQRLIAFGGIALVVSLGQALPTEARALPKIPACTITGSTADDLLTGTPRRDVICGLAGNDTIKGLGGDDTIIGGRGRDTLFGDTGNDTIYGGPQADAITGGPGINRCIGNTSTFDASDVLDWATCEDLTAPQLVSIRILTPQIDTKFEDQVVQWEIRIRDDLAGLPEVINGRVTSFHAACTFHMKPVKGSTQDIEFSCVRPNDTDGLVDGASATPLVRTEDGRLLEVVYIVSERIGRFAGRGAWEMVVRNGGEGPGFQMSDNVGNYRALPGRIVPGFRNGG